MRRLKILTWHTHGSYLYYLTRSSHEFYILSKPGRPAGYGGRCGPRHWGDHVHDQPLETLRGQQFDCLLFQDDVQFLQDQYCYLDAGQRALPKIYLEHDPPQQHPTDTPHPVNDRKVLLVHVTPFNALMWDNGDSPVRVIEHGVPETPVVWQGDLCRGISVVNHLRSRGRRLGVDIFCSVRHRIPLDLVGMGSQTLGGLGEMALQTLPVVCKRYRFFFHPARYTSLGLAVIEAMMLGMPVAALATTAMPEVIEDGLHGFIGNRPDQLVEKMQWLLDDHKLAATLGQQAQKLAREKFSLRRFIADWDAAFRLVAC